MGVLVECNMTVADIAPEQPFLLENAPAVQTATL